VRSRFKNVQASDSKLVLPLAALFVAFFVAPLIVLLALSLHGEAAMRSWTFANYVTFFGDAYHTSILWQTLLLGVKATLVCLLFG
jgi:putative spermidine/putrescine transport system permease protein